MFHVLLVLPVMAAFGAAAGAVLVIMAALLCGAFLLELLLGLFLQDDPLAFMAAGALWWFGTHAEYGGTVFLGSAKGGICAFLGIVRLHAAVRMAGSLGAEENLLLDPRLIPKTALERMVPCTFI